MVRFFESKGWMKNIREKEYQFYTASKWVIMNWSVLDTAFRKNRRRKNRTFPKNDTYCPNYSILVSIFIFHSQIEHRIVNSQPDEKFISIFQFHRNCPESFDSQLLLAKARPSQQNQLAPIIRSSSSHGTANIWLIAPKCRMKNEYCEQHFAPTRHFYFKSKFTKDSTE